MFSRTSTAVHGLLNSSARSPDPEFNRRAFICNSCSLIGAAVTSLFLLTYIVLDTSSFAPIIAVTLVLIPSYGIAVLLNRRGWFETAKLALFTSGLATLIIGSWMLGRDSGLHLVLLSFPVLALLMWDRQRLEITVPFTLVVGAIVVALHANMAVPALGPIATTYSSVFLVSNVAIALLLPFFIQYLSLYRMDEVNANLQTALDFMPGAIMAGNERGDVIFVNEQTNRLFNLPEGHIQAGSSLYWALDEMFKAGANRTDEDVEFTTDQVFGMFAARETVPLTVHHADGRYLEAVMAPTPSGGSVAVATDISKRMNAIKDAQAQRMIAERVLENMGEGLMMIDADGRIAAFNQRVLKYYDISQRQAAGLIGQEYAGVLRYLYLKTFNDPERYEIAIANTKRRDTFSEDDVLPNGRTLEVRHMPMAEGGYVKVYLDVTEMRRAASELQRQKEIADQALENMGEGLMMIDADGRIAAFNQRVLRYYDISQREAARLIGQEYAGVLRYLYLKKYNDPEQYEIAIADTERQDVFSVDETLPNGRILEVRQSPMAEGGYVKVYLDVTEMRRSASELQRQKEIADLTMENMGEGIMMVDADGKVAAHNRRLQEYFDVDVTKVNSLIGFDFRRLIKDAYLAFDMPEEAELSLARLDNETGPFKYDDVLPNGTIIETRHQPMANGGFVRIYVDVTENRRAEEELARQKDIATQAQQQAEESDRSKSEFLANMSHEIRTPMNAILGLTHLALKTELTTKQQDYLQKVHSSATSLLTIINDILDLSKIEAGKLAMEAVEFSLDEMLSNVTTLIGDKAQQKGLEFLFEVPAGMRRQLVGDPLRLAQVLINLANNAVKFTDEGEVVISVELLDETERDVQLQFTVRDTGIGLKPEHIEHLFESFSQADTSTTRQYGGTGLGLSISKRLVEMMYGRIWVESTFGEGSTFHFTARFEKSHAIPNKPGPTLAEGIRGRHVLVVDDNASARRIFREMLESLSLKVSTADGGLAGVEAVADATPAVDLVIVDWRMPDLDGFKTIEEIRKLPGLKVMPRIIMATAFGREEMFREAEAAELDSVILKPANPSTLLDAIMDAFGLESGSDIRRTATGDYDLSTLRPVQGARILVAEDNDINQQVVRELLEHAGFFVDIANHGREAVDMARSGSYDLVLMDVQMPELDGYEATRQIHALPGCAELPILALTSGVMDQEKQRSREAGMVDHVGKPIEIRQLYDALLRWIPHGQRALPLAADSTTSEVEQDPLPLHLEGIDLEQGVLRTGGNRQLYRSLLTTFVETKSGSLDDLRTHLTAGDTQAAAREAHGLAGVAGNIGAAALAAAAKDLEHGLSNDDVDVISLLLESAQSQMDTVLDSLLQLSDLPQSMPESSPSSGSGYTWEEIGVRLARLREMSEGFDPAVIDLLAELSPALAVESLSEPLRALETALERFDFEAALAPLEQLEAFVRDQQAEP